MTVVAPIESSEAWNAFAVDHRDGGFLQSWRWGDLKARYGWRAIRLALPRRDGGLAAGAQMLVRTKRLWPGGAHVGLAYVPRGPLAETSDDAAAVVRASVRIARDHGASFMRVEPPTDLVAQAVRACRFRPSSQFVQIPRTAMIELERSESDILGGFKSKMRYNIRLAGRRGVEVALVEGDADFEAFVDLMGVTASRERFAIHYPSYYRDVWQTFQPDQGALFIARYQGTPLAALMVVGAGRTAAYVFGGSSNQHRNLMAPHAVQWAAMQWARANGFARYDLWGMADPDDPADAMAGVHRFKLGFNPDLVTYPGAFDLPLQPVRAWLLTRAVRLREAIHSARAGQAGPV
ncbi:MAG: peptidoglycan bridge formation glycyltransferase FemA/FemB family protein [Chloroflexota bacterium]|nr:peptidoglycan bridge formation glycyltransferase FemA/FemB family protein [Chloroflexota bacterium]